MLCKGRGNFVLHMSPMASRVLDVQWALEVLKARVKK